jgi:ABC-type multidrug transport system fused ATPase/permease subunit
LDTLSFLNSEKALKSSFFDGMGRGMIMIVEGLTFWFAGMLFQDGIIENGNSIFIAIFSVIFAAMGVGQNSTFMPDMAKAKVAGASIFDIIESKTESELSTENGKGTEVCTPESIKGAIEFKNVTFKYPERDAIVL